MKITIQKIRELCTTQSFSRGEEYYSEGLVHKLQKKGNAVTAIVRGADDYRVEINIRRNTIDASCTCPYDWGGYCKHIVATLHGLCLVYINRLKKDGRTKDAIKAAEEGVEIFPEHLPKGESAGLITRRSLGF